MDDPAARILPFPDLFAYDARTGEIRRSGALRRLGNNRGHVMGARTLGLSRRVVGSVKHLTTFGCAELCGVSQQTVIRCFDDGLLKGFRVPGSRDRRIPRASLRVFMISNGIPTDALDALESSLEQQQEE
jgi:hypothetical protein